MTHYSGNLDNDFDAFMMKSNVSKTGLLPCTLLRQVEGKEASVEEAEGGASSPD